MGYEFELLAVDKHKRFLQIHSIILSVHSQACPKHREQQVRNIFSISQGKRKGRS